MSFGSITALIAEDEPLLSAGLTAELALARPELLVLAIAGDGVSGVAQALHLQPDVLFFDIQMPGMSGLDAAAALADAWGLDSAQTKPFPALVFVTAYDQYAVQAFEAQAADCLLKPVQTARLQKTVLKLRQAHINQVQSAINPEAKKNLNLDADMKHTLSQFRALLSEKPAHPPAHLTGVATPQIIQASLPGSLPGSLGKSIRMGTIADVLYLEAADKYIRVVTKSAEYLIRIPLKELLPQLPSHTFRSNRDLFFRRQNHGA